MVGNDGNRISITEVPGRLKQWRQEEGVIRDGVR